ncbi:protein WVD2-like 1-like, partial [Trifolium medium]|nr:protein WVD2-like 1-like [Trifolium medium]
MDDDKELSSPAAIAIPVDEEHTTDTSPSAPQQSDQATEKHVTHTQTVETEAVADDQNLSPKA